MGAGCTSGVLKFSSSSAMESSIKLRRLSVRIVGGRTLINHISDLAKLEVACSLHASYPVIEQMVQDSGLSEFFDPDTRAKVEAKCPACKGSGFVPRFPWARVECWIIPHDHGHPETEWIAAIMDCPGWREATLREVDLEDVLVAIKEESLDLDSITFTWGHKGVRCSVVTEIEEASMAEDSGTGDTPKEAALAALSAAEKEEKA